MAFPIESFSTYFCTVFSAPVAIPPELDIESQLGVNFETLSEVISMLREVFREEFEPVIEELIATYKFGLRGFMRAVMATCMKISEKNTTYAHFMFVCTLINGIVSDAFENELCFVCIRIYSCSLIAVYNRCYKDYFEGNEGETLDFHMRELKKLLETQKSLDDKRKLPILGEDDAIALLKSLVDGVEIPLKDCELIMLNEIISSMTVERSEGQLPSSSSESSCRDISIEDSTDCVPMYEDSSESRSKPSESDSSFRDVNTEDSTDCAPMTEDSSESSKPSESVSSGRDINRDDSMDCVPMYEDFPEPTSKPPESESSSGKDINTEDAMGCKSMYEDSSDSTSKPSTSYRHPNTEDSEKPVPFKKDYLFYKNRICEVCRGKCGSFVVSYIENMLEKCKK